MQRVSAPAIGASWLDSALGVPHADGPRFFVRIRADAAAAARLLLLLPMVPLTPMLKLLLLLLLLLVLLLLYPCSYSCCWR